MPLPDALRRAAGLVDLHDLDSALAERLGGIEAQHEERPSALGDRSVDDPVLRRRRLEERRHDGQVVGRRLLAPR